MTGLMTVAEVAEHLGVSESRARALLAKHGVTHVSGYVTDEVKAMPRPGRGARTDLKKNLESNS